LASLELRGWTTQKPLEISRDGKYAVRIITEENTRNICEAACKLALKRKKAGGKGKVTIAAKYNNLPQTDGLFRRIAEDTVMKYQSLTFQQLIIDNFLHRIVMNPQQFDIVVMPNEYGDILSDGGAALIGGLGLAPSACIGDDYAYFEPVHGSAPDIAGKNIINPTAAILSAALMLDYLGFEKEKERLENAVYTVYAEEKYLTIDQGGKSSTTEFCQAVKANL
jgi:isocitrate/isopropylmalate dehydrogenase